MPHDLGTIRPARRPAGWIAPGPAPAARPPAEAWPQAGEHLCYLAGDWRILQRARGHRWSLDDLVTAWCAAEHARPGTTRIADIGCGIGAVLLLLAWRFPQARCSGIEAQVLSAAMAWRSVQWNGVQDRCMVRVGDLRDPISHPEGAVYDLVTGTPPYLPIGTATEPTRMQQAPCHLEQRGGIEAYCAAAVRLLAPGGRFVCCHAASQRARVAAAARRSGLSIISCRDIIPRAGKAALFSMYVLRGHGEGSAQTVMLPPLTVRDASGQRTPEFRRVRAQMGMPP